MTMESFGLDPAFDGGWEQPIELVGITMYLEPDSSGKYNYERILENIEKFSKTEEETPTESETKSVVRHLELREIKVYYKLKNLNFIETPVGAPVERAEIEVRPDETVVLDIGTQSQGQGHETSFAQVVSEWLGVPFDAVEMHTGDTDRLPVGGGTHQSRITRS